MRRVYVQQLSPGLLPLPADAAHHLRDVLRLGAGERVELFDANGQSASAVLEQVERDAVVVAVGAIVAAPADVPLIVASAVPKNERADWLVEKLSEIGVARWIPLQTARSVVHPAGETKFGRWRRIAIESARQSRRAGVMAIDALTPLDGLALEGAACMLSTRPGCVPLLTRAATATLLIVGPEGGWTDGELDALMARGAIETALTPTILRMETAAVVAAGAVMCAR